MSLNLKTLEALFFDFDGVIVESASIKTNAYRMISKRFSEVEDAFVQYHIDHAGLSRYRKFQFLFDGLLKRNPVPGEIDALAEDYSREVKHQVLNAPFVPGALEFIEWASARRPLYLVSGTPDSELKEIIAARALGRYFREIRGFPAEKAPSLADWLARNGYEADRCVYIGDAMSDYEAARAAGVKFIGRLTDENGEGFAALGVVAVEDLVELKQLLTSEDRPRS